MKVKEAMSKDVKSINVPGNREEAIELIKDLDTSAFPVLNEESGDFVGILRLRTLFDNPDENQLGMLVKRDVPTISSSRSLEKAADMMIKNNVRRLPIINEKKLEGMLTVEDVLGKAIVDIEYADISDCIQYSVSPIWKETPLKVALEILNLSGERALPVLDDRGKLAGMIGDEDIIAAGEVKMEEKKEIMGGKSIQEKWTGDNEDRVYITKRILEPSGKKVADVMATDLTTASKRTSVSRAARLMKDKDLNQLPVLSGDKLIGMVSDEDLLKSLTK